MPAPQLERLVEQVGAALGESLSAVVLYGSAAAGEQITARSDINVLVIVESLPLESLHAMGSAVREWMEGGNPPPLVFTTEEWRGSADVFPMEYADILERHRVLFGTNPFAGISVAGSDLRLQVEQEARGKLLHLRGAIIAATHDRAMQLDIIEGTLTKLMILYRGVLRLHRERVPADHEALTRAVAALCGFDAAPVLAALRHVHGTEQISMDTVTRVADQYLGALESLVRYLDAFAPVQPADHH